MATLASQNFYSDWFDVKNYLNNHCVDNTKQDLENSDYIYKVSKTSAKFNKGDEKFWESINIAAAHRLAVDNPYHCIHVKTADDSRENRTILVSALETHCKLFFKSKIIEATLHESDQSSLNFKLVPQGSMLINFFMNLHDSKSMSDTSEVFKNNRYKLFDKLKVDYKVYYSIDGDDKHDKQFNRALYLIDCFYNLVADKLCQGFFNYFYWKSNLDTDTTDDTVHVFGKRSIMKPRNKQAKKKAHDLDKMGWNDSAVYYHCSNKGDFNTTYPKIFMRLDASQKYIYVRDYDVDNESVLDFVYSQLDKFLDTYFTNVIAEQFLVSRYKASVNSNNIPKGCFNFYRFFGDYLRVSSSTTVSLVHLLYLLTRNERLLGLWINGKLFSFDVSNNYEFRYMQARLLCFYLDHLAFNFGLSYNLNHVFYTFQTLIYRVFYDFLQVEFAVLSDNAIFQLLLSVYNDLTEQDLYCDKSDNSLLYRPLHIETYDITNANNNDANSYLRTQMVAQSLEKWTNWSNLTNQYYMYGDFVRIKYPSDQLDGYQHTSELLRNVVKYEVDADRATVRGLDYLFNAHNNNTVNVEGRYDAYVSAEALVHAVKLNNALRQFAGKDKRFNTYCPLVSSDELFDSFNSHYDVNHQENDDFDYSDDRMQAFKVLCDHQMCILTGHAGTGKTTLLHKYVRHFVDLALSQGYTPRIVCAAMAGKAVGNILDSFGDTFTADELAQYMVIDTITGLKFTHQQALKQCDLLIVDEYSMPDELVIADLLSMVNPNKCQVLFVGDIQQLPAFTGPSFAGELNAMVENNTAHWLGCAELTVQHRADDSTQIDDFNNNLRFDVHSKMSESEYMCRQRKILDDPSSGVNNRQYSSADKAVSEITNDYVKQVGSKRNGKIIQPQDIIGLAPTNKDCARLNAHIAYQLRQSRTLDADSVGVELSHTSTSDDLVSRSSCFMPGDLVCLKRKIPGKLYSLENAGSIPDTSIEYYCTSLRTSVNVIIRSLKFINKSDAKQFADTRRKYALSKKRGSRRIWIYRPNAVQYMELTFSLAKYPDTLFRVSGEDLDRFLYEDYDDEANVDPQLASDQDKDDKPNHKLSSVSLDLGYALTVHKAQGSTYSIADVYLDSQVDDEFLTNNWIYTASSRPKVQVNFYVTSRAKDWWKDVCKRTSFVYTNMHLVFELLMATKVDADDYNYKYNM